MEYSLKVVKCKSCGNYIKEKKIVLKTQITEEMYFCSFACLLFCLKEMCLKTFEIKPTQLGYEINKKVRELSW
jgi:hypothetical protein